MVMRKSFILFYFIAIMALVVNVYLYAKSGGELKQNF
jgi:hypothetical protein